MIGKLLLLLEEEDDALKPLTSFASHFARQVSKTMINVSSLVAKSGRYFVGRYDINLSKEPKCIDNKALF
jgi:hypothetical protein